MQREFETKRLDQLQLAVGRVDAHYLRGQAYVDILFLIEVSRPDRKPFRRRRACQKILRQIRPITRQIRVAADEGHRAGVAFAAQGLCCRVAGSAATHNDDRFRRNRTCGQCTRGPSHALADHPRLAIARLDLPAAHATQCWRSQCLASAQAKGRVVPRAPHRITHHKPFGQRASVVRTGGAYGK